MTSLQHPNTPDQLPFPTAEQETFSYPATIYAKHEPGKNGIGFAYTEDTARKWQAEGHKVYISQTDFAPLEPLASPADSGKEAMALLAGFLSQLEPDLAKLTGQVENALARLNAIENYILDQNLNGAPARSKRERLDPSDPALIAWEKEALEVLDRYEKSGKTFCLADLRTAVSQEFREGFAMRITRDAPFKKRFVKVRSSSDPDSRGVTWYAARWAVEGRSKS